MTGSDWLTATDPQEMLRTCGTQSDRKLRLFLVACARRVLPTSPDEAMLDALAVAEQYADGAASWGRLVYSRKVLKKHHGERAERWPMLYNSNMRSVPAWYAMRDHASGAAWRGARACAFASTRTDASGIQDVPYPEEELLAQGCLLRDIFGPNPFRPPYTIASAWLAWDGGTIPRLSEAACQERALPSGELDPDRLAVLADALEEVGADSPLLEHLLSPGPHVRGCFVIDMLTGRE